MTPAVPIAVPASGSKVPLIITSLVFALWIAALLTMYVKTVYPQRHPEMQPKPASIVSPQDQP